MREEAKPFLHSLALDADESRFSVCINDYSQNGMVIAHKGDLVCINEHSFHNVTEDKWYFIAIKDKTCFNPNGPLPTYWIH
jgi:hypothetical protein